MRKISVLIITILFIYINSITANNKFDKTSDQYFQENSDIFQAYFYVSYDPSGGEQGIYGFNLETPGNLTLLYETDIFFTSACFVYPFYVYFCNESGDIWTFNITNLELDLIGSSGLPLNGLAYDFYNDKLYGASNTDLYEIDKENGSGTYIGNFGGSYIMISIAYGDFICYGLDIITDSLYNINVSNGYAQLIGFTGINFNYAQDLAYDKENSILYLAGYTTQGGLYIIDTTTGQCTLLGYFPGGFEVSAFAITYNIDFTPPLTQIIFDPPSPDGNNGRYVSNVTVELNASDNYDIYETYYRLNKGEWIKYNSPFTIYKDGEYLIEYYSIDFYENIEDVKSENISIDETPPEIDISYEFIDRRTIKLTAACYDNTSGISHVDFLLNDIVQKSDDTPPYSWIVSWPYPPPQSYLKVLAYDKAGNIEQDEMEYTMPWKMYIIGFIRNPEFSKGYLKFHADFVISFNYFGIIRNEDIIIELFDYEGNIGNRFINAKIWAFWIPVPKNYFSLISM